MKTQAKDMTKGHPGRLLLQFALPLMLGNIFQQTYTMVDTAVVGQLVGVHALAALGSVDWFNWMSLGICSGLSQGFSIMIAQQFGAKEYEKMKKTVGVSLILAVLSAIVVTVVFLLSAAPVLRLMGTREEILGDALLYVSIMFSGILIVMIYNWMSSVLRAIGDSTTPLIAMGVASSSNVVLDLLFVAVFHWGIAGAAAATLIAQGISCVYCFLRMRKVSLLRLCRDDFSVKPEHAKELFCLGMPMAVQNMIISIGGMILQSIVNGFGVVFVAGFTATNKLYGLLEIAAVSMGFAVSTYAGQNLGAGEHERIKIGVRKGAAMAAVISVVISMVMLLLGRKITGLFVDHSSPDAGEVLNYAYHYLVVLSLFLVILYCLHIYRSALQGMGNTIIPLISGFVELTMRLLTAVFLPRFVGEYGIYFAEVAAWTGAAVLLVIAYQKQIHSLPAKNIRINEGEL